tara:strand:- start:2026 stop:4236 length:2211 start_codon:yes stop_codon:yes gene_type:complete
MKKIILILALGFSVYSIKAQITGEVFPSVNDKHGKGLPGANVYWEGANTGTSTDTTGAFMILPPARLPANLIISFIGFKTDTIKVFKPEESLHVGLIPTLEMDEFVVQERKQSTSYDMMSIRQIEQIGASELTRAACCNISEAFETNASVDVVSSDGVTGAKKIQMLGLDGIYTSLQFENIPLVRGLANLDGLAHIPGSWVQSIQISKGSGSVVNGYEGMTGQINLEFLKPDDLKEKVFINLYGNVMGRSEINAHIGDKLNEKWSTLFLAHANMNQIPLDNNNDGFMDVTLKKQLNLFSRWKYKGEHYRAQFGVRGIVEEKTGGEMNFNPETNFGATNLYGVGANGNHIEGFYKSGIVFDKRPWRSLAIITRGSYHDQTLFAGLMNYKGNETYFYSNFIFSDIIKTTEHKYKLGASYVFDDYNETFNGKNYVRTEHVPGIYGEYTFARDKIQTILGARSDFHNLYGTQVSPKANFKYEFSKRGAARVSMGRGFRVANIFVDNNSTFVSQRVISIQNNLLPEVAWNTGISATQKVEIAERDLTLHVEYFYTQFENQVVVDRETPGALSFYNLTGSSYSNAIQVEVGYEPWKVFEIRTAIKYLDVQSTYAGVQKQMPLVPNWRGMVTLGYQTLNKKWQADFTTQFVGESRIPSTIGNAPENIRNEKSSSYFLINTQLTRRFRHIEVYAGSENLGDYRQPNAIISADKPFDSDFDASMIWGPIFGRSFYAGLRLMFLKS